MVDCLKIIIILFLLFFAIPVLGQVEKKEKKKKSVKKKSRIEFSNYFVIVPAIGCWDKMIFIDQSNDIKGKQCEDGFSYNSATNNDFLSVQELNQMIFENIPA